MNKYNIFKIKLYTFYPIYEWIYKNKYFHNHKSIKYDKIKLFMNKYLYILPIYRGELDNLNIEHIWCKEWIKNIDKKDKDINKIENINDLKYKMINDMHHLYLANQNINSLRKNYKFRSLSILTKNTYLLNEKGKKIYNDFNYLNNLNYYCKVNDDKECFEPPNESKDIIIRTLTYLLFRYPELTLNKFENIIPSNLYLQWFYKNKIEYNELLKNELIYLIQNNKNIFINYPILIPLLFDDSKYIFINLFKVIPNQIYCLYTTYFIKKNLKYYYKNKIY